MTDQQPHALDALRVHLRACLLAHQLAHTHADDGERFPLLDKLCAPGDPTTGTGTAEIALLAEAIVDALPAGAAPAVRDGNLHAVMEAAAWRNAMTGLCTIWPKTADEAAEHLRRRLHPQRGAAPAREAAPSSAPEAPAVDYTVVQAFADQHGVPYDAACAMVHAALRQRPAEPIAYIQRDHLAQARRGAFLCRVEATLREGMGLAPFYLGAAPPESLPTLESLPTPDEASPDTELLDWLERQGTVYFDYETAQVAFPVPESLGGGHSLREIVAAARRHDESQT